MILANGLTVLTGRVLIPWTGVWSAELVVDGDVLPPAGPVAIVGDDPALNLVGSLDADGSGLFAEGLTLAVVGGMGGWGKPVRPQHFQSDAGVPLASVITATAAEVKEPPPVVAPETIPGYVRVAGAASQVLEGRSWWVGLDGVTVVGPRPPKPQPLSLEVFDWDPTAGIVTAGVDEIVEPGTVLVDLRFGTRTVRDVELVFSAAGIVATLWVVAEEPEAAAPLELVDLIGHIARKAVRPEYLRVYECRVIAQDGEKLEVQPTDRDSGAPEFVPVPVWSGIPGYKAKVTPGMLVMVGFRSGDPLNPYVTAFEDPEGPGWAPIEATLDAKVAVNIGELAALVKLAGGALPVARVTDTVQAGPFSGTITGPGNPKVLA